MLFAMCVAHVTPNTLAYSRQPAFTAFIKIQKSEIREYLTRSKETQKIQLFNAQKTDREIELISRKSPQRKKRKDIQKKKLNETQCDSNINIAAEQLVPSVNIASQLMLDMEWVWQARYIVTLLLSIMDEVYHQSFLKKLSNNLKLLTKQFRKVLSNEQKKEINTRRLIVQLAFLMKKKTLQSGKKKNGFMKNKYGLITLVVITQQYHTKFWIIYVVIES